MRSNKVAISQLSVVYCFVQGFPRKCAYASETTLAINHPLFVPLQGLKLHGLVEVKLCQNTQGHAVAAESKPLL